MPKVPYSCKEIDAMQKDIAGWMESISLKEYNEDMLIKKEDLNTGYDILLASLYFLDILRFRIEKLRELGSDNQRT